MKYILALPVIFFFTGNIRAQWVVTDPLNTAQGIINAGNTASTVNQMVENVKKLQTTLDYVQKVSATVKRARMFKDLIDRQNRLNGYCLETLEDARSLKLGDMDRMASSIQGVITGNAAVIELTAGILSSDLKMNDAERIGQLDGCMEELERQEKELSTIRQIIGHIRETRRNLGVITE